MHKRLSLVHQFIPSPFMFSYTVCLCSYFCFGSSAFSSQSLSLSFVLVFHFYLHTDRGPIISTCHCPKTDQRPAILSFFMCFHIPLWDVLIQILECDLALREFFLSRVNRWEFSLMSCRTARSGLHNPSYQWWWAGGRSLKLNCSEWGYTESGCSLEVAMGILALFR